MLIEPSMDENETGSFPIYDSDNSEPIVLLLNFNNFGLSGFGQTGKETFSMKRSELSHFFKTFPERLEKLALKKN